MTAAIPSQRVSDRERFGVERAARQRMAAIRQDQAGGAEVLRIVECDRPEPDATEILVRVHATSVNPHDCKTRARGYSSYNDESLPFILGFDVSGVVEAVGSGVTVYQPGDEVFGAPRFPKHAGAYAEYVTGPARHFAPKPTVLDHLHSAGLPLAGVTAWQALVDTAHVQPGQRVLIHAAAGGVGHLAVQIAKARGAYVIGTARAAKHEFLRDLGADELIDYTRQDFDTVLRDIDIVLDSLGGEITGRSLTTMRPAGTVVTIVPPGPPRHTGETWRLPQYADIDVRWLLFEPDGTALRELAGLVDAGKLRVQIDSVFPLAKAADAHRYVEAGNSTGKVVLEVVAESPGP